MPKPQRTSKKTPKQLPPGWSKLTNAQKRLVEHPPTPKTWRCKKKREQEGAMKECGMVNSGRQDQCQLCAARKPSKPVLLWPLYLEACRKAGIEPKAGAE